MGIQKKSTSEKIHASKSSENLDTKTKADQFLDDTLAKMIAENQKVVAAKAEAVVVPRADKEAANKSFLHSKTTLSAAENTEKSEVLVATTNYKNAMSEALSTKNKNIANRQ